MKNKYSYITVLVLVSAILLFSLVNRKSNNIDNVEDFGFKSVDAVEFSELVKNENAFLLDVHIPEQAHIPGTDAFIPYNELEKNINQLPKDKDKQILVYCRSGSMSREASYKLSQMGYTNIIDLSGGINAYKEANVSVSISPETFDLGAVIYGDIATTEFTLTNFTPIKLNITRVSTSCSCTSAKVEKEILQPYESTAVKVSFDPAVHKDNTDLGELTRTIYIDTDNPNFEQVTAIITANVIKK